MTEKDEKKDEKAVQDQKEHSPEHPLENKTKDSALLFTVIVILVAFILVIFIPKFVPQASSMSLDELHEKNLAGKLSPDKGYVYNGLYSFVLFDDLWYTQLVTSSGEKQFNIPFHYGPRDVEDIEVNGELNYSAFDKYKNFFMTFDPIDENLNYIAVSTGEAVNIFIQAFGKGVIGACTNNETTACQGRPIVQCNSTDAPVFYFASEDETNVLYLNNCVVLSGNKEELFRATDRMLFDLLGIIEN